MYHIIPWFRDVWRQREPWGSEWAEVPMGWGCGIGLHAGLVRSLLVLKSRHKAQHFGVWRGCFHLSPNFCAVLRLSHSFPVVFFFSYQSLSTFWIHDVCEVKNKKCEIKGLLILEYIQSDERLLFFSHRCLLSKLAPAVDNHVASMVSDFRTKEKQTFSSLQEPWNSTASSKVVNDSIW